MFGFWKYVDINIDMTKMEFKRITFVGRNSSNLKQINDITNKLKIDENIYKLISSGRVIPSIFFIINR